VHPLVVTVSFEASNSAHCGPHWPGIQTGIVHVCGVGDVESTSSRSCFSVNSVRPATQALVAVTNGTPGWVMKLLMIRSIGSPVLAVSTCHKSSDRAFPYWNWRR